MWLWDGGVGGGSLKILAGVTPWRNFSALGNTFPHFDFFFILAKKTAFERFLAKWAQGARAGDRGL